MQRASRLVSAKSPVINAMHESASFLWLRFLTLPNIAMNDGLMFAGKKKRGKKKAMQNYVLGLSIILYIEHRVHISRAEGATDSENRNPHITGRNTRVQPLGGVEGFFFLLKKKNIQKPQELAHARTGRKEMMVESCVYVESLSAVALLKVIPISFFLACKLLFLASSLVP